MDDVEYFLLFVIQNLVQFPEHVYVQKSLDEKGVLFSVTVESADLGRVIGKQGSTANSIRQLLHALGAKHDAWYNMKILEPHKEETK